MNDKIDAIACMPVDVPGRLVPFSALDTCDRCGATVWISPSSRAIIHRWHPEIICLRCWGPIRSDYLPRLAAGQLEEVAKVGGPEMAMWVARFYQNPGAN